MAYSLKDVIGFPPPSPPPRTTTIAAAVAELDGHESVLISYAFGSNAPTLIPADRMADVLPSNVTGNYGRMFTERRAYYWNPNSPDYDGN